MCCGYRWADVFSYISGLIFLSSLSWVWMCDVSSKDRWWLNSGATRPSDAGDDVLQMRKKEGAYIRAAACCFRQLLGKKGNSYHTNRHTHIQTLSIFVFLTQSSLYGLLLLPKVIRQCDPSAASTHRFLQKANYPHSLFQTNRVWSTTNPPYVACSSHTKLPVF